MKKKLAFLLAAAMVMSLLAGCKKAEEGASWVEPEASSQAAETAPAPTTPPDGDPGDVTCKGSYTGSVNTSDTVARVGEQKLTSGLLQAFYWAEAAAYRQENHEYYPDYDQPLDVQPCPVDGSVGSWQQYFLRRALNAWHTAQALQLLGEEEELPTEEAYQPDPEKHAEYMTDMPANKVLYGNFQHYVPNSMHQAYLDGIPQMLEDLASRKGYGSAEDMAKEAFGVGLEYLTAYAHLYNWGYMYFTTRSYDLTADEDLLEAGEKTVDLRQILLHPQFILPSWQSAEGVETAQVGSDGTVTCSEELWEAGEKNAEKLLKSWKTGKRTNEATFAELAHANSLDAGSAVNGGLYRGLRRDQLLPELEAWCFDQARKPGDTTILRTRYGHHILYFSGSSETAQSEEDLLVQKQAAVMEEARERFPMTVDYPAITLGQGDAQVSAGEILYPDVAHERFPEAPLYIQQDYPDTMYGKFPIRSHGCGITTMAMLASYMTDELLTPPMMCERYGSYSHKNGTDGMMFIYTPAEMGFYLKERTFQAKDAKKALEEGYIVVSVQTKGYWTRGGHYLLLEKMNEDGRIQVRDSNLYNYGRLEDHKIDSFEWKTIPPAAVGFWIFENKITTIPGCTRCGGGEEVYEGVIPAEYMCPKCRAAEMRRESYLGCFGE